MPPSYDVIEIDADAVGITMRQPGQGTRGEEPLAHFARRPLTTSEFYPSPQPRDADPAAERFMRYAKEDAL